MLRFYSLLEPLDMGVFPFIAEKLEDCKTEAVGFDIRI